MMNSYITRSMTPAEADWAIELAAREGWNPGLHDSESFYRTDPQGFLVGLLEGRPIGSISAVSYEGKFGFLGLYIVLPEYRGRGYGLQLWQAAMQRLQGHNIGLDSVPSGVSRYIKSGFRPAYNSLRFEGIFSAQPVIDSSGIVNLKDVPFTSIRQYDQPGFPADRTVFLENWLKMPESTALGLLEAGRLNGYGVIRRCRQGYKIGPLLADNALSAERLLVNLISKIEKNTPFYLDVPEPNTAALALASKYRMKTVFSTVRMYTGSQPEIKLSRVFGVTSFELG